MIDDRGVTAPIEYVLTFTIAGILITGLIIAATGHVESQRSRTVQAQMDVVGQQLAGSLEVVDREIQGGSGEVRVNRELPEELLGQGYTLTVHNDRVTVTSRVANANVDVPYSTETPVTSTPVSIDGGKVIIEGDGSQLEVRDV